MNESQFNSNDLAMIVNAENIENIGKIVKLIESNDADVIFLKHGKQEDKYLNLTKKKC